MARFNINTLNVEQHYTKDASKFPCLLFLNFTKADVWNEYCELETLLSL